MKLYALSSGCIYGEMENDTGNVLNANGSRCQNLVTAVCRDCPEEYCEHYTDAVYSMSEAECDSVYDDLLDIGC